MSTSTKGFEPESDCCLNSNCGVLNDTAEDNNDDDDNHEEEEMMMIMLTMMVMTKMMTMTMTIPLKIIMHGERFTVDYTWQNQNIIVA